MPHLLLKDASPERNKEMKERYSGKTDILTTQKSQLNILSQRKSNADIHGLIDEQPKDLLLPNRSNKSKVGAQRKRASGK